MSPGCVRAGPGRWSGIGRWPVGGVGSAGPAPGMWSGAAVAGGRGRRAVRSCRQPLPASLRRLRSPDAGAGILETRGSGGAR